jgi:hypothetical protein
MTHNARSRIVSFRVDHNALEVLEWEAARTGIPLRTRVRAWVEARAEEVASEYRAFQYERVEKPLGDAGEEPVAAAGEDDHDNGPGGQ